MYQGRPLRMVGAYLAATQRELSREAIKPALIPTKKANRDKYLRAGATLLQSEWESVSIWLRVGFFFQLVNSLLTDWISVNTHARMAHMRRRSILLNQIMVAAATETQNTMMDGRCDATTLTIIIRPRHRILSREATTYGIALFLSGGAWIGT